MTLGERALVDFCETNRVPIKRILEGDKKEPDYEMSVGKQQIFVEVKDLDLNPEEKQASRALKEGGMPLWGSPPGARVRTKIDKARRQLKNCAESGQPALLVLFDTRSFPFNTTEPYDIKVAMYGFETYVLSVPLLGMGIPKFTEKIFGKDRKCSLETNTYISAIGLIVKNESEDYELHVYHNAYADVPICTTSLGRINDVRQYGLKVNLGQEFDDWVEI